MDDSVMSLESVRRRSGQFDLSSVRDLDYSAAGVREIANLEPCVSLVRADFSRNKIRSIGCLSSMPMLEVIDLSWNNIASLDGFGDLAAVKVLKLQSNQIVSIDTLKNLEGLSTLKQLYLSDVDGGRSNPVCSDPSYMRAIMTALPHLEVIDGQRIALRRCEDEFLAMDAAMSSGDVPLPPSLPWIPATNPPASTESAIIRRLEREFQDALTATNAQDADAVKLLLRAKALLK